MKKRNIAIIVIFVAIIAAVKFIPGATQAKAVGGQGAPGASSGGGASGAAPSAGASGGANAEASVYSVKTAKVEKKSLQDYLETNGDVVTETTVGVYPDISGKLSSIKVDIGSRVAKGQVIAWVDPSKPGATYSLSPVYAPITGTVTSMDLHVGATVTTSSEIAEVGVMNQLLISALVPERDVAVLSTGLKADVTLEAFPGVIFKATVNKVAPLVNATSRTKEIRLAFDTKDERVNVGMFAKVKLYTTAYADRLTIPQEAIVSNFGKEYVFVANTDGTVSKKTITAGVIIDGVAEVLSGLEEGEKVITQGMQVLSDGAKYRDIAATKGAQS